MHQKMDGKTIVHRYVKHLLIQSKLNAASANVIVWQFLQLQHTQFSKYSRRNMRCANLQEGK